MEKISLIIPCKNEVESLGAVLEEVNKNKFVDEIIVVVDSETDNSIPITKKYNCKLIVQKNKGYGSAIVEGFKNAKNKFGCIYNADHSFDPKYFDEICLQKKFTFSQKVTLRKYLTQWQARFPLINPLEEIGQRMTASQILKKFSDNLLR